MIKYHYIFPTVIAEDTQLELANQLLPVAKEYISTYGNIFLDNPNHLTTVKDSSVNSIILSDERIFPFLEYVFNMANDFLKFQRIQYKNYEYKPFITFNKIQKDGYHKLHSHPNCLISGCFYLHVPNGSSDILFKDPRDYHRFYQLEYNYEEGNGDKNCLNPQIIKSVKTGDFLMWNSWLEHEVLKNNANEDRYTMVFNLKVDI